MQASVPKITLVKAIKVSQRRSTYRRWEAKIFGRSIILRVIALERLYRGNTPYPIGKAKISEKRFATTALAQVALRHVLRSKTRRGYVKVA